MVNVPAPVTGDPLTVSQLGTDAATEVTVPLLETPTRSGGRAAYTGVDSSIGDKEPDLCRSTGSHGRGSNDDKTIPGDLGLGGDKAETQK